MERVMARIFRQRRIWIGKGGVLSREGVVRWSHEMRNVLYFMAGSLLTQPCTCVREQRPYTVFVIDDTLHDVLWENRRCY